MNLKEKLQADLVEAQKAKDELKVSTLRMLSAAIKNYEIEKGGAGFSASEEDVTSVIQKQVKQRRDSIESYKAGGRAELADKEAAELEILQAYLPAQMSEENIEKLVETSIKETGASSQADIGKVMGKLSNLRGKADMSMVSSMVKKKLT